MNIQLIIVFILIAGAVLFLGIKFYKTVSGKNKSGDCPNCAVDEIKKQTH